MNNHVKQTKKHKFVVLFALVLLIITPTLNNLNLFFSPYDSFYLNFLGFVFFDGFELATLTFFFAVLIIFYQLLLIIFYNGNTHDINQTKENADTDDVLLNDQTIDNDISENIDYSKQAVNKSFEEVDGLISQLDLVLKKSRHDVFNLMLDPNGINSPDDFQSAVESLELALSCLRSIHKQINEMKKNV